MRITISHKLRPFSHIPGTFFILPGSTLRFQIFPAYIRVHDLTVQPPLLITEIPLSIQGPVRNFTVLQDLEKPSLHVWGHTLQGYMRYTIYATAPNAFSITTERSPTGPSLFPTLKGSGIPQIFPASLERLSFGCHKGQDWTLIQRRRLLEEIFPLWFTLGQLTPKPLCESYQGSAVWLKQCEVAISQRSLNGILTPFYNLLDTGFEGGLSPRLEDTQYQGFALPPLSSSSPISPLILLSRGAELIRNLCFHEKEDQVTILPALPPLFHAGRLLNLRSTLLGLMDLEWSKKQIRRIILKCKYTGEVRFHFQSHLKLFRIRHSEQDKGRPHSCVEPVELVAGKLYYFDRFQK
jgi:hypothetical protein